MLQGASCSSSPPDGRLADAGSRGAEAAPGSSSPSRDEDAAQADATLASPTDALAPNAPAPTLGDAGAEAFAPASHGPLPTLPFQGGALLASIEIVTITWSADALEASLQAFDAWIPSSAYYTGTLAQYDIGPGSRVATWSIKTPPPASLDSTQIAEFLLQGIAAGSIPPPTANRLYNIYPPPATTVTETVGGQVYAGCTAFQAFHDSIFLDAGLPLVYALNPRCQATGMSTLDYTTLASSHEIAEAATDPLGDGWFVTDPTVQATYGTEVGDFCISHPITQEGHVVTALWSNSAAKRDERPCVPAPPGPMFGATVTPRDLVGTANGTLTTKVTVFSKGPLAPLHVSTHATGEGIDFGAVPSTASNGDAFTLTLNLADAAVGPSQNFVVLSTANRDYRTLVPFGVTVQ